MGIVDVAFLKVSVRAVPVGKIKSGEVLTTSRARLFIVFRSSLARVSFHNQILVLNVSEAAQFLNKARYTRLPVMFMSATFVAGLTKAMRFIFAGCCARTANGQAVAAATAAMKSRRFIANPPTIPTGQ